MDRNGGPSNMFLDVLTLPEIALFDRSVRGFLYSMIKSEGLDDALKRFASGSPFAHLSDFLFGTDFSENVTGADIVGALGGDTGGVHGFLSSLAVEIVAGPSTYLGVGAVTKIGKAAKSGRLLKHVLGMDDVAKLGNKRAIADVLRDLTPADAVKRLRSQFPEATDALAKRILEKPFQPFGLGEQGELGLRQAFRLEIPFTSTGMQIGPKSWSAPFLHGVEQSLEAIKRSAAGQMGRKVFSSIPILGKGMRGAENAVLDKQMDQLSTDMFHAADGARNLAAEHFSRGLDVLRRGYVEEWDSGGKLMAAFELGVDGIDRRLDLDQIPVLKRQAEEQILDGMRKKAAADVELEIPDYLDEAGRRQFLREEYPDESLVTQREFLIRNKSVQDSLDLLAGDIERFGSRPSLIAEDSKLLRSLEASKARLGEQLKNLPKVDEVSSDIVSEFTRQEQVILDILEKATDKKATQLDVVNYFLSSSKRHLDNLHAAEEAAGIMRHFMDGYAPRILTPMGRKIIDEFMGTAGSKSPQAAQFLKSRAFSGMTTVEASAIVGAQGTAATMDLMTNAAVHKIIQDVDPKFLDKLYKAGEFEVVEFFEGGLITSIGARTQKSAEAITRAKFLKDGLFNTSREGGFAAWRGRVADEALDRGDVAAYASAGDMRDAIVARMMESQGDLVLLKADNMLQFPEQTRWKGAFTDQQIAELNRSIIPDTLTPAEIREAAQVADAAADVAEGAGRVVDDGAVAYASGARSLEDAEIALDVLGPNPTQRILDAVEEFREMTPDGVYRVGTVADELGVSSEGLRDILRAIGDDVFDVVDDAMPREGVFRVRESAVTRHVEEVVEEVIEEVTEEAPGALRVQQTEGFVARSQRLHSAIIDISTGDAGLRTDAVRQVESVFASVMDEVEREIGGLGFGRRGVMISTLAEKLGMKPTDLMPVLRDLHTKADGAVHLARLDLSEAMVERLGMARVNDLFDSSMMSLEGGRGLFHMVKLEGIDEMLAPASKAPTKKVVRKTVTRPVADSAVRASSSIARHKTSVDIARELREIAEERAVARVAEDSAARGGRSLAEDAVDAAENVPTTLDEAAEYVLVKRSAYQGMQEMHDAMVNPLRLGPIAALAHKATNLWKTWMTAVRPGFHMRNYVSDVMLAGMAGMTNPKRLTQAAKLQAAAARGGDLSQVFVRTTDGKGYTGAEVLAYARRYGLMDEDFQALDLLHDGRVKAERLIRRADGKGPVGKAWEFAMRQAGPEGWASRKGRHYGAMGQNNVRLALMMDYLAKGSTMDVAIRESKRRLVDYSSHLFSHTERSAFRLAIPFYSWLRRSVPLMIENIVDNPKSSVFFGKALRAIGSQSGASELPDELVPDFVTDMYGIPWKEDPETGQVSYFLLSNWHPAGEVVMLADGLKTALRGEDAERVQLLRQLAARGNPYAKIPLELMSNFSLFSGKDIERYEGQSTEMFGVPFSPKAAHLARSVALLSDLDKLNVVGAERTGEQGQRGEPEMATRLAATFLGFRPYQSNVKSERDRSAYEMDREIGRMKGELRRLLRKPKTPGRESSIEALRQKLHEEMLERTMLDLRFQRYRSRIQESMQ